VPVILFNKSALAKEMMIENIKVPKLVEKLPKTENARKA